MGIELKGQVENFLKDKPGVDKLIVIEYDGEDQPAPVPILCGECWLNSAPDSSPKCKN